MTKTHTLGFPRIGKKRELKFVLEKYWNSEISENEMKNECKKIRQEIWNDQKQLDFITVGDFSLYDHVLDTSFLFNNIPKRFNGLSGLNQYFAYARGKARNQDKGNAFRAGEMTKWFDTNYHFIVPEFDHQTTFKLNATELINQVREAKRLRSDVKVVLLGPLTYLYLGKSEKEIKKLELLEPLVCEYVSLFKLLNQEGVSLVQIDEPILVTEIEDDWKLAFKNTYKTLSTIDIKILIATYFDDLKDNLELLVSLPSHGIHIDLTRNDTPLENIVNQISSDKFLSLGVIDGRNIWVNNYKQTLDLLRPIAETLKNRLYIAPSCSLLHVPVDLDQETELDEEFKSYLAFAKQKLVELDILKKAILDYQSVDNAIQKRTNVIQKRSQSTLIHDHSVKSTISKFKNDDGYRKSTFEKRKEIQNLELSLPLFPTTTIGSFPQTKEIRLARKQYKNKEIDQLKYESKIKKHIEYCIDKQEEIGLDVLVHGEAERNDMVEYFGENLSGFIFTQFAWVQSYGSRCVKPPIIIGDVSRNKDITIDWIRFAQSKTSKVVKGMLTGPVTMLNWSFVRDDQPRSETCLQIAVALRDEVKALESSGVKIIQIDEAALREGMPLRDEKAQDYLEWAVRSFRITAGGVSDKTQIHTHMCYSNFNPIIKNIAQMDADVITIETSRSNMKLLKVFKDFEYKNDIGPGVYDIHSPNIPENKNMKNLIKRAAEYINEKQLWINPDCGLKTRNWSEVEKSLIRMVDVAKELRTEYNKV